MDFSFQLYSARNVSPITGLFAPLATLGYASVEAFGGLYDDVEGLSSALKASGLRMPTGHFGLEQLENRKETLQIAAKLGIETLICPFVPPEQRSRDRNGWEKLARVLDAHCAFYNAEGLKFGWHNHDFEFAPLVTGELPMTLLLDGAPQMGWQADIAWIAKSGADPQDWIERQGHRIISTHVKDIAPTGKCLDEDGWADLGEGVMDWRALFKSVRSNTSCTSFVMEHDNPSDVERFARRSIAAAVRLWDETS